MLNTCINIQHFDFSGYIDLSKRRVSPEEVCKCEEKFAKAKAVSEINVWCIILQHMWFR